MWTLSEVSKSLIVFAMLSMILDFFLKQTGINLLKMLFTTEWIGFVQLSMNVYMKCFRNIMEISQLKIQFSTFCPVWIVGICKLLYMIWLNNGFISLMVISISIKKVIESELMLIKGLTSGSTLNRHSAWKTNDWIKNKWMIKFSEISFFLLKQFHYFLYKGIYIIGVFDIIVLLYCFGEIFSINLGDLKVLKALTCHTPFPISTIRHSFSSDDIGAIIMWIHL